MTSSLLRNGLARDVQKSGCCCGGVVSSGRGIGWYEVDGWRQRGVRRIESY